MASITIVSIPHGQPVRERMQIRGECAKHPHGLGSTVGRRGHPNLFAPDVESGGVRFNTGKASTAAGLVLWLIW